MKVVFRRETESYESNVLFFMMKQFFIVFYYTLIKIETAIFSLSIIRYLLYQYM